MKINGTLISYYIICKRKLYLHAHNITCEDNSQLVKIGKFYHEERKEQKNLKKELLEIELDNVKIDQIGDEYVVEFKKKNSDIEAARMQLLYYLHILKQHGIERKGRLQFKESRNSEEVILDKQSEANLKEIIKEIKILLRSRDIPPVMNKRKCRKCAYFEFCYS